MQTNEAQTLYLQMLVARRKCPRPLSREKVVGRKIHSAKKAAALAGSRVRWVQNLFPAFFQKKGRQEWVLGLLGGGRVGWRRGCSHDGIKMQTSSPLNFCSITTTLNQNHVIRNPLPLRHWSAHPHDAPTTPKAALLESLTYCHQRKCPATRGQQSQASQHQFLE